MKLELVEPFNVKFARQYLVVARGFEKMVLAVNWAGTWLLINSFNQKCDEPVLRVDKVFELP